MRSIRSCLLLLLKGRDLILFNFVYCSRLGLRTRGSHVRALSLLSLNISLSTTLIIVDRPTLLSSSLPNLYRPLPTVIISLPSVESNADISTGPSPYPSYHLPPIRNNMYPRRPPNSLRLVPTPLKLKSTSYKHSTSPQDIREPLYDSQWKEGDGGYEDSGMVGFVEEG